MREAQEIIASVHEMGGEIDLRGDRIHFRLPRTPEAPRLVEELRARREEVIATLKERATGGLTNCGSPHCAGCLEVEPGVRLHPPKSSEVWKEWLLKWEPKGRVQ